MDVVVIGGGLVGLAAAWRIGRSGHRVTVRDQGATGGEASWAGAGMLAPGGEMETRTWWGDLALESLRLYPEFVRELQQESGRAIDYRQCGALESAATDREWQLLLERAGRQRELGIPSEHAVERTLFYPEDAAVDPRDLLTALRIACVRAGATILENQPVREILIRHGRMEAPACDAAVLAAGAWSSQIPILVDGSPIPIEPAIPIRGHLIAFQATQAGPIRRQGHTYLVQRASGLTIAGSSIEQVGFRRDPDPALFDDIEQRARSLMPELSGVPRVAEWIGFRPGTASGEPQLGRLHNLPVFLAYGHFRNGILMAPRTAALIADAVNASSQMDWSLQAARPLSDPAHGGTV